MVDQIVVQDLPGTVDKVIRSGGDAISRLTTQFAEIADKGVGNFLVGFGAASIVLAILFRAKIINIKDPIIGQTEFICIFTGGFLMLLAGAFAKLYVFYVESDVFRKAQRLNGEILKDTLQKVTQAATTTQTIPRP